MSFHYDCLKLWWNWVPNSLDFADALIDKWCILLLPLTICIPFRRLFKVPTTFSSPVSLCDTGRTDLTPETMFICLWLRAGEKHYIWSIRAVHVGNCAATSCLHEDGHFFIFLLHTNPILVCMIEIWRVRVGLWVA